VLFTAFTKSPITHNWSQDDHWGGQSYMTTQTALLNNMNTYSLCSFAICQNTVEKDWEEGEVQGFSKMCARHADS